MVFDNLGDWAFRLVAVAPFLFLFNFIRATRYKLWTFDNAKAKMELSNVVFDNLGDWAFRLVAVAPFLFLFNFIRATRYKLCFPDQ